MTEKRKRAVAKPRIKSQPQIDLADFSALGTGFHASAASHHGACATVCLRHHWPKGAVALTCQSKTREIKFHVRPLRVTQAMRRTYADLDEATQFGACGMALLLAARELGARFVSRQVKGTAFDYFVAPPGVPAVDPMDPFANCWALETTGILTGTASQVQQRIKEKRDRLVKAGMAYPSMIAVVEFSEPRAIFERV